MVVLSGCLVVVGFLVVVVVVVLLLDASSSVLFSSPVSSSLSDDLFTEMKIKMLIKKYRFKLWYVTLTSFLNIILKTTFGLLFTLT